MQEWTEDQVHLTCQCLIRVSSHLYQLQTSLNRNNDYELIQCRKFLCKCKFMQFLYSCRFIRLMQVMHDFIMYARLTHMLLATRVCSCNLFNWRTKQLVKVICKILESQAPG